MKVALPIRRSLICNYQRLTYPLPTFNTHKRYAGTPLFVCNSCTVICFVRCNTRNPRLSASGQTQSKTRTTDFFCLTFSNQSLMWTFRFQLETANKGFIFHRGREDRSCWRRAMALYYKQMSFCYMYSDLFIIIINSDDNHIIMIVQRLSWFYDGNMK